ncbi:prolactin-inducible protein homolog [Macrotis lagotis]|uniref:prolactin-inducible protein homolog n=1 Tax=Macrotis lagotis TaxID=92651 RepID=UPI003D6897C8
MSFLQAFVRCSLTALFLGLYLQLAFGKDDYNRKRPLIVKMSSILKDNITEETNIQCNVSTQMNECVPIKAYILMRKEVNCYPKPVQYKACICPQNPARNFSWKICNQPKKRSISGPVSVYCMAGIINEPQLCLKEEK